MRWEDINELSREAWKVYAQDMRREPWEELSHHERRLVRAMIWRVWRRLQEELKVSVD